MKFKNTKILRIIRSCGNLAVFSLMLGTVLPHFADAQAVGSRKWTGTQSNIFNPSGGSAQGTGPTKNWEHVSGGNENGGINDQALIVDIPANNLVLSSAGNSPFSLHIMNGASGFTLRSGGGTAMTIKSELIVDANTTATFDGVGIQATTTANSTIRLDIGSGGALNANQGVGINAANGRLIKDGQGTLVLRAPRAIGQNVEFLINEGTLLVDTGASFAGSSNPFIIRLGTSSTVGTLEGRMLASATLVSASTSNSILKPEGVLNITNADLSAGATIHFDLGSSDLITGSGALTLGAGDLVFNFTGAEVGQTYTIFDYDTVTGFDASRFLISTAVFEDSVWSLENGVISVEVIPEPMLGALLLVVPFVVMRVRRKLKQHC